MARNADREKFRDLLELVTQEQAFFWQRFSALATLQAALVVLVTAMWSSKFLLAALAVTFFSLSLALLWVVIQEKSFDYLARWKQPFHNQRRRLGIKPSFEIDEKYGAARLTRYAPRIMLLIWVFVLLVIAVQNGPV